MDHDQFWKHLIHLFLPELFDLFFPELVARLDFARVQWLEQEVFPNPPKGEKNEVDLVASVPTIPSQPPHEHEPADSLVLIHIENEANMAMTQFDPRMYRYYNMLRNKHQQSVLPIAIFTHVMLDGRGTRQWTEHVWHRTPLVFTYDYLALPGLPNDQYLNQNNMLGVAWSCIMQMPREQRLPRALDALDRIAESEIDVGKKYALMEFVQNFAPSEETNNRDLLTLLTDPKRETSMAVRKLWSQIYREQLREEVVQEERQKARHEAREEVKHELLPVIREEAREEAKQELLPVLREEAREEAKQELLPVLREEVREEVKKEALAESKRATQLALLSQILAIKFAVVESEALRAKLATLTTDELTALAVKAAIVQTVPELGLNL